jgi:hypothetical protein
MKRHIVCYRRVVLPNCAAARPTVAEPTAALAIGQIEAKDASGLLMVDIVLGLMEFKLQGNSFFNLSFESVVFRGRK